MSQWLNWGSGSSGSPAVSGTINTYATCTGTAGQTVLTTTLSASDGDMVLIHQSQHASAAGTWEIVKVSSDAGATLNLYSALANSYSAGAQCVLVPQYTGGTLSGAVTCTAWNGSTGGIIALMSNGDLTITGSLSVSGAGYRYGSGGPPGAGAPGQQGYVGESTTTTQNGSAQNANITNGGGGGRRDNGSSNNDRPGGGGGGNGGTGTTGSYSGNGTAGTGAAAAGNAGLTTAVFGGGGGGGAGDTTPRGCTGGNGAGFILLIAKTVDTTNATITLTGNNGETRGGGAGDSGTSGTASGGGGGGAGGSCLIKTTIATLGTNRITAAAGSGTVTYSDSYAGGAGGAGRIHVDYFSSYTGTTTPTLDVSLDTSLYVPASAGFIAFL